MSVVTKFFLPLAVTFVVFALMVGCQDTDTHRGLDVAKVLQQARKGDPVQMVALGGSITLGGEGWIREWLTKTFPQSAVFIQNSGLGGTGSDLGLFRLERDVIAYQPNLVFIEFSVNDGMLTDDEAIRNMESIIVRLRELPQAPAIVLVIAAQEDKGLAKERIQRLAAHYNLLVVDLDEALHRHIEENKLVWDDFMQDAVHPNTRGHAFYAEVIAERLAPLLEIPVPEHFSLSLPHPLSKSPLLLEATMMPLTSAPGWETEDTLPGRAFRLFPGLISASSPGVSIQVPFEGTRVGLFFPLQKGWGSFYANIDGQAPQQILENMYEGYGFVLLADDLAPGQHVLSLVLPPAEPETKSLKVNGPVKLGSVLVAGTRSLDHVSARPAGGAYTAEVLAKLRFQEIPPTVLAWIGPFMDGKDRHRADVTAAFPPEQEALQGKFPAGDEKLADTVLRWMPFPADSTSSLDLAALAAGEHSRVFYLATRVISPVTGPALLRLSIKGRRQIWVNGTPVTLAAPDSDSDALTIVPIELRAGANTILWKVGTTKGACAFSASITLSSSETLELRNPLHP